MTPDDVFREVVGALERADVPYMLTGSFASSFHGAPRATQDIDIVVAPDERQLRTLVRAFPESDWYVDEAAALDALSRRTQFNVIDHRTGWKVDFILRKNRPFSLVEFQRRTMVDFEGIPLVMASAEDVLLSKLEWAHAGGSDRHVEDAAGIVASQGPALDLVYVERWARDLGVADEWRRATARAAGLDVT